MTTYPKFGVNLAGEIQSDADLIQGMFLAATGVNAPMVRMQFRPDRTMATLTHYMDLADDQNIQILPVLIQREGRVPLAHYGAATGGGYLSQGDWMAWVTELGNTFGIGSGRERPLYAWEVWNEPNTNSYWKNGSGAAQPPDPTWYAVLYAKTAQALRASNPYHHVIHGAPAPAPGAIAGGGGSKYPAYEFVKASIEVLQNANVGINAFAAHPYAKRTGDDDGTYQGATFNLYDVLRALLHTGKGTTPTWITEFGWNSDATATRAMRTISNTARAKAVKRHGTTRF